MAEHSPLASSNAPVPVAPSLEPALAKEHVDLPRPVVDNRLLFLCVVAAGLAAVTSFLASGLVALVALVTNLAFYGKWSMAATSPADHTLGGLVVIVPVVGGALVGLMARYGSKAIRGHGIPEAMERVLSHESVIPARLTFLKPISAAISIGTGGPFGAEGPIIATGGSLGSLVGQILPTTAQERKTLLAAGAAAGMTAIFGSPIAAILLAIELLVFEYRPRSFVPIAIAAAIAGALHLQLFGTGPAFAMGAVAAPTTEAMLLYFLEGLLLGAASVLVTKIVYGIEDAFERLPIPWMWWPAIGGIVVGVVGWLSPHTLGVGYDNIERMLAGDFTTRAVLMFCALKFVSWSVALGTGTSGGTLAPLFTVGGALGLSYGALIRGALPNVTVDPRVAALVGMAGLFAGASRAVLASIVFAFETTRQPWTLLPLLAGGIGAYVVSSYRMRNSIMTEKIARRGVNVPNDYAADPLAQTTVGAHATAPVHCLRENDTLGEVRAKFERHQGYPVVDDTGRPIGFFTRKDFEHTQASPEQTLGTVARRTVVSVSPDALLSIARDRMVRAAVGRVVVVEPTSGRAIAILSRSDVLRAYSTAFNAEAISETKISLRRRTK